MVEGRIVDLNFDYVIKDEVLDNWDLLKILREIDKGNSVLIVDAMEMLLGEKQEKRLENAIKKKCGRVSTTEMMTAFSVIMQNSKETKKS